MLPLDARVLAMSCGSQERAATQFLYSRLGKKLLKKTDDGWTLMG